MFISSVRQQPRQSFRLLGYCPQFDALNLELTGEEQLTFYARLHGVHEASIDKVGVLTLE